MRIQSDEPNFCVDVKTENFVVDVPQILSVYTSVESTNVVSFRGKYRMCTLIHVKINGINTTSQFGCECAILPCSVIMQINGITGTTTLELCGYNLHYIC